MSEHVITDLFDEVADMIVDVRPFGIEFTRAEVLASLREDFPTEADLRAVLDRIRDRLDVLRDERRRATQ
jgi:hypothetical protein